MASRERDRPGLQPQLAGAPDALDVVDRRDLVGLGKERREPARSQARDVVGATGEATERIGQRRDDPVAGVGAEALDQSLEPVELEDDDRRGAVVASDPRVLVGHEPVEGGRVGQAGQGVDAVLDRSGIGRRRR